jgi:hypothetical protein
VNGPTVLARNAAIVAGMFGVFTVYALLVGVFLVRVAAVLRRCCGRIRAIRAAVAAALRVPPGDVTRPDTAVVLSLEEEAAWVGLAAQLDAGGGGQ